MESRATSMSAETSGLIGASLPRSAAGRGVAGQGQYTDDIAAADALHVAFLRSPHAHARILSVALDAVRRAPGVVAAMSGRDLAAVCKPWITRLALLPKHVSAPQYPLAIDEVCFQGEAVVAIVAETRAAAEDALQLADVSFEELPHIGSLASAYAADAAPVHSSLTSNLALDHLFTKDETAAAFATAAIVVAHRFDFGRQTGVTLEPRSILARFDPALRELTVHQSHQAPFQMREIYAAQLDLSVEQVRVIAPDIGGAFGLKLHAYADEMAVVAIATMLRRPVKFVADRIESFVSDAHAREMQVDGRIVGLDVDVVAGFGAYSCYPRGSVGEALQAGQMAGAPYEVGSFRARVRGFYQNKVPTGAYRGVGQPVACAVTEQLIDLGAARLGIDPAALRRLNFRRGASEPSRTDGGIVIETLSLRECLDAVTTGMAYDALREEQRRLRRNGVWRGIGLSAFIEVTGVGPGLYGPQELRVSAQEACRVSLQETGTIRCETSVTDQGQGTLAGLAQILAQELGVALDEVWIVAGDTARVPYGGGAWASRGLALGGEAALRAARALRENILVVAASLLQTEAASLDIAGGIITGPGGLARISLADLAATIRFRSDLIPVDRLPPLEVIEHAIAEKLPYLATNGVQAASVEVDIGTGIVRVLDYWVADDCGRVINPMLVDEQIRGGVVQGIGAALFEHCRYSDDGQLVNGSLADYSLPLASEMPDISIFHVSTPTKATTLGARGVGEAGTVGAVGAIWTAVNDALRPHGCILSRQPFTPEVVLDGIDAALSREGRSPGAAS